MAFAVIVSFASCSSEDNTTIENESATKLMTFTATQESDGASTKATLDTNGKTINWEKDDKIKIYDGTETHSLTLKGEGGSSTGTFQGEANENGSYTAVYPYYDSMTITDGSASGVNLPANQTPTANSFDKNAALMMAKSTNTTLSFKNAVGYVKVTPKFACSKIVLQAAVASEYLAGKCTLSYDNNTDIPSITFTSEQSTLITLSGDITANTAYYIAVPAVTLSAGWSISFTDNTGDVYTRTGSKEIEFKRNTIINLGEFSRTDNKLKLTLSQNGNVPADKQVDMGVFTINEINYRLIFTKSNLKKEGYLAEKEYDFGDYFAWGATEPWCTAYTRTVAGGVVTVTATEWNNSQRYNKYDWSTVPFRNGTNYNCSQYTGDGNVLDMEYDAANVILGGKWKLPTKDIWMKLYDIENYEWELTTKEGYNGYQVTSKTDNTKTIFLPAAGRVEGEVFNGVGSYSFYWSGSALSNTSAYGLSFSLGDAPTNAQDSRNRYYGFPVRPVRLVADTE